MPNYNASRGNFNGIIASKNGYRVPKARAKNKVFLTKIIENYRCQGIVRKIKNLESIWDRNQKNISIGWSLSFFPKGLFPTIFQHFSTKCLPFLNKFQNLNGKLFACSANSSIGATVKKISEFFTILKAFCLRIFYEGNVTAH